MQVDHCISEKHRYMMVVFHDHRCFLSYSLTSVGSIGPQKEIHEGQGRRFVSEFVIGWLVAIAMKSGATANEKFPYVSQCLDCSFLVEILQRSVYLKQFPIPGFSKFSMVPHTEHRHSNMESQSPGALFCTLFTSFLRFGPHFPIPGGPGAPL